MGRGPSAADTRRVTDLRRPCDIFRPVVGRQRQKVVPLPQRTREQLGRQRAPSEQVVQRSLHSGRRNRHCQPPRADISPPPLDHVLCAARPPRPAAAGPGQVSLPLSVVSVC